MTNSDTPQLITNESALDAHVSRPLDEAGLSNLAMPMTEDDVVISTFPKCGTTWSAQICHGLRSDGDNSFTNLSEVFPWLEMGHLFGHDMNHTRTFRPGLFKSHMELSALPPGAKVINIVRNPADTLLSYYNFWSGTLIDPDAIMPLMMARALFAQDRREQPLSMFRLNYFEHLVDFHTTDYDGQVLYIAYEDMKLNLPAAVRRISRFMGFDISKTLERKIVSQSTFEFMSRQREKYQEQVPGGRMEMVVNGRVGDGKAALSTEVLTLLDNAWQEWVTPNLGYRDYDELRGMISL